MDPNQPDNSLGGPTPEVATPTPEVTPIPENTVPDEPTLDAPTAPPEPVTPEQPMVDPMLAAAPDNSPIDVVQPIEPPAPIAPEAVNPVPTPVPAPIPTPTPMVQPVAGGVVSSVAGMPTGTPPKSKKGLIIGLVAGIGGLIIIGVVLFLILVVFNSGQIKNFAEFKDALENHKAVNCTAAISENGISVDMTIQATDGWNKMHMSAPAMMGMEMWGIREGDEYVVYASISGQNIKSNESAAEFDKSMGSTTNSDAFSEDTAKLDCKPNNQANFDVPDRDWKEDSSFKLSF
jgi:hypothetical protein